MAARPPSRNSVSQSTIYESETAMSSAETLVATYGDKVDSDPLDIKKNLSKASSSDGLKSSVSKSLPPGASSSTPTLLAQAATSSTLHPTPSRKSLSLWRRVSSFFISADDEELEDDPLDLLYCDNSELQTRLAKLRNNESIDVHVRLNHGPDRRGLLVSSLTPFDDFVELVCAKFEAPYGSLGFQFDGEEESAFWEQDSGRGRVSLTEGKDYSWAMSMALLKIEANLVNRLERIERRERREREREERRKDSDEVRRKREIKVKGKGKANAFDPLNLFHLQVWCIDLVGNRHEVQPDLLTTSH